MSTITYRGHTAAASTPDLVNVSSETTLGVTAGTRTDKPSVMVTRERC